MKTTFTIFIFTLFIILLIHPLNAQIGHWENLNPQHHPPSRSEHGMAKIGTKKVLLFGGIGLNSLLNDTWIFDLY
jgi:hypothetical protein